MMGLFDGKPRDPNRIRKVIAALGPYWERMPDLRLGQLIVTLNDGRDPFNLEDDELLRRIEKAGNPDAKKTTEQSPFNSSPDLLEIMQNLTDCIHNERVRFYNHGLMAGIASERERCAKIADNEIHPDFPNDDGSQIAKTIGSYIRSGGTPAQ